MAPKTEIASLRKIVRTPAVGSLATRPKEPPRVCPFETVKITCRACGGKVNVFQAGPQLTEVHCDDCGSHYAR